MRKIKKYNIRVFLSGVLITLLIYYIYTELRENYTQNNEVLIELAERLEKLDPRLKNIDIFVGNNRTYTINKKKVYLCMRDEKGNYYNKNNLFYALMHEGAHTLCNEVGHTEKFYQIFDQLIDKATRMGLYDPRIEMPKSYCNY